MGSGANKQLQCLAISDPKSMHNLTTASPLKLTLGTTLGWYYMYVVTYIKQGWTCGTNVTYPSVQSAHSESALNPGTIGGKFEANSVCSCELPMHFLIYFIWNSCFPPNISCTYQLWSTTTPSKGLNHLKVIGG